MKQYHLPAQNVKKSNAICRAYWTPLNVYEPRIIALLASQIQPTDEDFKEYEIPFTALFGETTHGTDNYNTIRRTLKSLVEKSITIKEDDGSLVIYPIFYKARITPKKNSFTIAIHDELKQHFLDLKQHYTQYNLLEFLTLSSTYSQRLFEYLKSWEDCESTQIAVEELHKILGVPDNYKANFYEFKRRALEPALKEINNKTGLNYSWQPVKAKNKVVQVVFLNSKPKAKTPDWLKKKIQKAQDIQNENQEEQRSSASAQPVQANFSDLIKQMEEEKKRLVAKAKKK